MDSDPKAVPPPRKASPALPAGTRLAGRFRIEELAGRGGMGSIYRAFDDVTGQGVALKLLHLTASPEGHQRFQREASLIAGLRHPGIVAHVAHGLTEHEQPFLAMEWLEGEDLNARLGRAPLSLSETLTLVRRAAGALAHAHRQGIVHRDLKPSNLFLRGGRPEDVVLLDFGLARQESLLTVTSSRAVVGTPGYMAPEQASSLPQTPPAADVFSLGCVLYECLTGISPFAAPHFAATMAKILFEDPAPLRSLRPGLPSALQTLVDRMLHKSPTRRLADADRLLEALAALEAMPETLPPSRAERAEAMTLGSTEQQLVSVLLMSPHVSGHEDETADWDQEVAVRDALRTVLVPAGGQVELLADGSLVATLVPERGMATDQAALAARWALTFKERWPQARVVLVTGRGLISGRLPVGDAMDRAGLLLGRSDLAPGSAQVVLDEVTAGLLGPGFRLSRLDAGSFLLEGEKLSADASRPLLGKPTPCVGREQELALLEFALNTCVEEPCARAVLVTAPAGAGKSRLRHEFLRRLERREPSPLVLMGRGEPLSTGASQGLLAQALRGLCGILEGQPPEEQRERLARRFSLRMPEARGQGLVEFLGELCSVPFADEHHPTLRAARADPRLMNTQVGRALVAFLEAECAHQPVLLVFEDLHWGDALTVAWVEEALRALAERPFLVLALARPEVKDVFNPLWPARLQEVVLHGLSRKAGGRLVREVLGTTVPESLVQRLVELSDGNALFLEELIRMAAEGRGSEAPETVLAVLQARLRRMDAGMRQVLLAASFFGQTFWSGGVGEVLGSQLSGETLARHLRALARQEVIEPVPGGQLPAEEAYRFRHALVRDAAYALVADSYRPVGHRLAGTWLEGRGEADPLVLATHQHLGERPERAQHFYTLAAERLLERNDLPGTLRCVEAARTCGEEGRSPVRLRALQAVMAFWSDDALTFMTLGSAVQDELEVGGRLWCWVVGGRVLMNVYIGGSEEEAARHNRLLRGTSPTPEAVGAYTWAVACLGLSFAYAGARWSLEDWLGWMKEGEAEADRVRRTWTRYLEGLFHHLFTAHPWRAFERMEQSTRDFHELGLERDALIVQIFSSAALAALGDVMGAVERLREVLADCERLGAHLAVGTAQHFLARVLAASPEPAHRREALTLVRDWMDGSGSYAFRRGIAHSALAQVRMYEGELARAEAHARQACELLAPYRADVVYPLACLSDVLLARGQAVEAREVAERGVRALEESASQGAYAVSMRLALAEACLVLGDVGPGEAALREAVACVQARARDIPEPEARERFLNQVPANARTLRRARERWGEDYSTGK